MQSNNQSKESYRASDLREEVVQGLLYAHSRANANTTKTLKAASFLYALIELMSEKGLITVDELDERKRTVGEWRRSSSERRVWGRCSRTLNMRSIPSKAALK
jgi:hypothetical protein